MQDNRANVKNQDLFPKLGVGLGLRPDFYSDVLGGKSSASWFEVVSENFMGAGGRPTSILEKIRADRPIVLHGVSLSIGSADRINKKHLKKLRELAARVEPALISDHACWTGLGGENLHDLLPLPYTEEAVKHVVGKVEQVQNFLGRRILLENVSSYLSYTHSEMQEWEFLSEIAHRADCGLLLDLNNVYVSAVNHGFDPMEFLNGIPIDRVGQFHLAGHSSHQTKEGRVFLIDTHDHPVCPEVWTLYKRALERFGAVSTMIEWDGNIPPYKRLEAEMLKARKTHDSYQETAFGKTQKHRRSHVEGTSNVDAVDHHRA